MPSFGFVRGLVPIYRVEAGRVPAFPEDPLALTPRRDGLVGLGGELSVEVVLEAYKKGIFPWTGAPPIPWYSPDPRMVLEPGAVVVSRSLRQVIQRGVFRVEMDRDFAGMMKMCATTPRPGQGGTWITPNMVRVWGELHQLGYAHSVGVYQGEGADEECVGGLYGLQIGRAFFGESMCSHVPNASKVALVWLCRRLCAEGVELIDCQQETPHLASMGARPIPREEYVRWEVSGGVLIPSPRRWRGDPLPFSFSGEGVRGLGRGCGQGLSGEGVRGLGRGCGLCGGWARGRYPFS